MGPEQRPSQKDFSSSYDWFAGAMFVSGSYVWYGGIYFVYFNSSGTKKQPNRLDRPTCSQNLWLRRRHHHDRSPRPPLSPQFFQATEDVPKYDKQSSATWILCCSENQEALWPPKNSWNGPPNKNAEKLIQPRGHYEIKGLKFCWNFSLFYTKDESLTQTFKGWPLGWISNGI